MAEPLGECHLAPNVPNVCQVYDQAPVGDIDHDECIDGFGNKRKWPMTVFLHDPCDMLSKRDIEQGLCKRKRIK